MDRSERRAAALQAAAALPWAPPNPRHLAMFVEMVTEVADAFEAWIAEPPPIVFAEITAGTPEPRTETTVSLVMPDNDKITLSVAAMDAMKVVVPGATFTDPDGPYLAPFTWAVDNAVLGDILSVSDDTLSIELESFVGQVGTVAVTATDANGKALPSFTVEIDPSAVTTAGIVAGTPTLRDDVPTA